MERVKIWHATSRGNLEKIRKSGHLRGGSYVTTAPIKHLTSSQRKRVLCLHDLKKGECACEWEVAAPELKVPFESSLTCSGYPQNLVKEDLPIDKGSCSCELGERNIGPGQIIVGGLLVVGVFSFLAALLGTRRCS